MTTPPNISQYDLGDLVRIVATFIGTDGISPVLPSMMHFLIRSPEPGGSTATYLYGAGGASIIPLSSYAFAKDFSVNLPGLWSYRGVGTGQGQGAEEWKFFVASSAVI